MLNELYFINARELAKKLAQNSISEKVAFFHFLAMTVLTGSIVSIPIDMQWAGKEPDSILFQVAAFIVVGAIQYWGFTALYKINSDIDGKDFFLRYAALSLPVGVQMLIASIVLSAIYGAIMGIVGAKFGNAVPKEIWLIPAWVFGALLAFLYFKILFSAFKEISEYKNAHGD